MLARSPRWVSAAQCDGWWFQHRRYRGIGDEPAGAPVPVHHSHGQRLVAASHRRPARVDGGMAATGWWASRRPARYAPLHATLRRRLRACAQDLATVGELAVVDLATRIPLS